MRLPTRQLKENSTSEEEGVRLTWVNSSCRTVRRTACNFVDQERHPRRDVRRRRRPRAGRSVRVQNLEFSDELLWHALVVKLDIVNFEVSVDFI